MRVLLVGIIFGAIMGIALGMLIAPTKGSETRGRLRERAAPIARYRDRWREQAA